MKSEIKLRPQGDPKLSQSILTKGSTNRADLNIHPQHSQLHSFPSHRSSSQSRESQTAGFRSPIYNLNRSVSQSKPSQNAHFLDGFNVANCFDVRRIPDPPLLSPSNSRMRHRRCVSSSVLRLMSSTDVRNRQNNQVPISVDTKPQLFATKKRKTLPHAMPPLNSFEQILKVDLTNEKGKKGMQSNPCRDDYDDDMVELRPRRKKKRQSIVIPRHLPMEADICSSDVTPIKNFHDESRGDVNLSMVQNFSFDFEMMQKVRHLIRGYCAISAGEERRSSVEAKKIQCITGYVLPPKKLIVDESTKSEAILSNRRHVIQKIEPVLAQMECRKKQDIKKWEDKTKCRVTKSEKSGRYRYFDIQTNKKVGSQEYKRRYLSTLQDERPNRISNAHLWMSKLNHNPATLESKFSSTNFPSSNMNCAEQDRIERETKQKEAFSPPSNTKILKKNHVGNRDSDQGDYSRNCDLHVKREENQSAGISLVKPLEISEIAEITEASSEDTDEKPQGPRATTLSRSTISDFVTPLIEEGVETRTMGSTLSRQLKEKPCINVRKDEATHSTGDKERVPLLPFPSKDMGSMDPEIEAAEKRLWDKIDLALKEYSGEVMNIERKKRQLNGDCL
eukprot:CAMPEP_0197180464 /NCGR_PEP_ID=MMETSP1423-20130617/5067_1 /TAXON_ID=476441 /ORGANISM="Pseudo-nitzschia heimii, Strain UNC1101" /LENGTH=617 /DNA_ID=CAMNT_0042630547 /DNA_START=116 /DNA_END=1969 /DNA_ORIENTATION=-